MKLKLMVLLLLALSQTTCDRSKVARSYPSESADWNKHYWFDKAKRTILMGAKPMTMDEERRLLALPRDEIVDALMAKPEFYNTALDFNMYFLGRRIENLVDAKGLVNAGMRATSAVNSAVELARDGDYFTLFQWSQPYSSIQDRDYDSIAREGIPASLGLKTRNEYRAYWIDQAKKDLKRIRNLVSQTNGLAAACDLLNRNNRDDFYTKLLFNAALPENLIRILTLDFNIVSRCGSLGINFALTAEFKTALGKELDTLEKNLNLLPELLAKLPPNPARTVKDLTRVAYDKFAPNTMVLEKAFDDRLWAELPNFSTNFNRRRAAYVLKTYFCDDLTPINIATANTHSENKHASDASCAACHYKLDPMAGFFRSRGIFGTDFENNQTFSALVHDDFALREGDDLKSYEDEWRSEAGSGREWNVGYIRSTHKESLNSYGESLDDLFTIIRASRESKVCLARRLAEYVLGSDQVYDGGWVDSLAETLHKAASPTASAAASSLAFKTVFKTLILSQTFSTADVEAGRCYDFAAGAKSSNLPCAVASIVQKNCAGCHRGDGAAGGLDLTHWETAEDGRFKHIDAETNLPITKAESFRRINERISSNDPSLQMPMMRAMDTVERATLFKWISAQQAGVQK